MGSGAKTGEGVKNVITHLSFSRLKNLDHSPAALYEYMTGEKKRTTAIHEGDILDCYLYTPEQFVDRFYVIPPTAVKPSKTILNAKKPSPESLQIIAQWEKIERECGNRAMVTTEQVESMKFLAKKIEDNSTVVYNGLLRREEFTFQKEIGFFYRGFWHKGKLDADGHDRQSRRCIWDLKRMGNASGERKVRWEIKNNLLDLQSAIYCYPEDEAGTPVLYYIIAVDNKGYVTPFRISRDARERARVHWNKLIKGAHQCNMTNDLSGGPEFWADWEGFFDF